MSALTDQEKRAIDAIVDAFSNVPHDKPMPAWSTIVKLYQKPRGPLEPLFMSYIYRHTREHLLAQAEERREAEQFPPIGTTRLTMTPHGLIEEVLVDDDPAPKKRWIPPQTKQEICGFIRQGEEPAEIGSLFGLDGTDVLRIAASAGAKPPVKVPAPVLESVQTSAPEPLPPISPEWSALAEQVEAARKQAVATGAPVIAATQRAPAVELSYDGAVWTVECSPFEVSRIRSGLEAFQIQTVRGSSTTEYELLRRNLEAFADGFLRPNQNTRRLKFFKDDPGRSFYEVKGFQARLFVALMTCHQGGRDIKRCGLVYVTTKKSDNYSRAELDTASRNADAWRAWREAQDAQFSQKAS